MFAIDHCSLSVTIFLPVCGLTEMRDVVRCALSVFWPPLLDGRQKPRHAAALALVGWYLMVPPVDGQRRTLTNAPLTRWSRVRTFDSEHACKELHASLLKSFKGHTFDNFEQAVQADRVFHGRCIATDDPRLKEK